jgi:hypothetical protein
MIDDASKHVDFLSTELLIPSDRHIPYARAPADHVASYPAAAK